LQRTLRLKLTILNFLTNNKIPSFNREHTSGALPLKPAPHLYPLPATKIGGEREG